MAKQEEKEAAEEDEEESGDEEEDDEGKGKKGKKAKGAKGGKKKAKTGEVPTNLQVGPTSHFFEMDRGEKKACGASLLAFARTAANIQVTELSGCVVCS